jgi:hypothetical protein
MLHRLLCWMVIMLIGGTCMADNLICDKCGSSDIETTTKHFNPPHERTIKMPEFTPIMTSDCVYRPITYMMRCRECGFKCEVTK